MANQKDKTAVTAKDGVLATVAKNAVNAGVATVKPNTNVTLRNGSTGADVVALQNALIAKGYDVGSAGADGILGKDTTAAIKAFQTANGLEVDGIAGKNTLGLLYSGGSTKGANTTATTTPTTTRSGGGTVSANVATGAQPTATKTTGTGTVAGNKAPAASTTPTASANNAATTPTTTTTAPPTVDPFTYDPFTYDPFNAQDNALIQEANALLQNQINAKPGEYTPEYLDEADSYRTQYENRDPFSYDFNSDALYNQYKDQYIQQGKMAMMDTMGQAAALTGGYGSSYAQTAGQQAYNQQLGQLNEIMPELYNMAYDRYNQEGQKLLDMYNLYMDREREEYSKYQDSYNNWFNMLGYYTDNYNNVYNREYGAWHDKTMLDLDTWNTDLSTKLAEWETKTGIEQDNYWKQISQAYAESRDKIEDDHWQQEFDQNGAAIASDNQKTSYNNLVDLITSTGYTPSEAELKAAGMTPEQAKAYKNYYDSATSAASANGTETEKTDYFYPNYDERTKIEKDIAKVTSLPDLEYFLDVLEKNKYDPNYIALLYKQYSAKFLGQGGGTNTNVGLIAPTGTSTTPNQLLWNNRARENNGVIMYTR